MAIDRRKRKLTRKKSGQRKADIAVVVTEGEVTEAIYFSEFNLPRIEIRVVPSHNGKSAPRWIIENAKRFVEQFDIGAGDTLWIVIDVDSWKIADLANLYQQCRHSGFELCVSNPCFEAWLAFHCVPYPTTPITKAQSIDLIRQQIGGYQSNNYRASELIPAAADAAARAQAADNLQNAIYPQNPGSRVYKLISHIL